MSASSKKLGKLAAAESRKNPYAKMAKGMGARKKRPAMKKLKNVWKKGSA